MDDLPKLPESDWTDNGDCFGHEPTTLYTADQMRQYAMQAVMLERERCAKIAESYKDYHGSYKGPFYDAAQYHAVHSDAGASIAAAIRQSK